MFVTIRRSASLVAFLCVLWPGFVQSDDATAQNVDEGVINAVSFEPLPEDISFLVRPLDDTDENLAIKAKFEAELVAGGLNVATEGARFVLSFGSRQQVAAGPAPRPQTAVRIRDQGGRMSTSEPRYVSRLVGTGREGTQIYRRNLFRIDATIDDKMEGTRLWQGWAIASVDGHSHLSLAEALVPAIVDSIGHTVREKPIQLD